MRSVDIVNTTIVCTCACIVVEKFMNELDMELDLEIDSLRSEIERVNIMDKGMFLCYYVSLFSMPFCAAPWQFVFQLVLAVLIF